MAFRAATVRERVTSPRSTTRTPVTRPASGVVDRSTMSQGGANVTFGSARTRSCQGQRNARVKDASSRLKRS
jgi:hypothetical protein